MELQLEWINACDLEIEELRCKSIKIYVIMFKIELFWLCT